MAGVEKLIQKMKDRPNGIRFAEIVKVLRAFGYEVVRIRGSHHQFRNAEGDVITIPKHDPVMAAYVKEVLKRIGR